jgi:hypothetical protein
MTKLTYTLIGGVGVFVLSVVPVSVLYLNKPKCNCHVGVEKKEYVKPVPTVEDLGIDIKPVKTVALTGREGLRELLNNDKVHTPVPHPLVEQRRSLGGHKLTKRQKIHFYALAIAELGTRATQKDFAMLMETAYNRGMTEGDSNINQNLTRAYYEPLRQYKTRKKSYKVKRYRTVTRYKTVKITAGGWKNYTRYKNLVTNSSTWFNKLDAAHDEVLAGSNYSDFGTQNASAGVARSARRTQTVTAKTTTGETISRKDLSKYVSKHGYGTIVATKRWLDRTKAAMRKWEQSKDYKVASND